MGKLSAREWLIGDYDYGYLCKPELPYCTGGKKRPPPKFFGRDSFLGIITAAVMGLQHALAMIGGLTTVPFLIGALAKTDKTLTPDEATELQQYLISAALIVCGIMSFIQVTAIPLPRNRQLGAGLLSVMGVSFTTFAPAESAIKTLLAEGNTFKEAYGYVLGTAAMCGLVPVMLSLLPHKVIKRIFPPIVCGVTIVLIGFNLTGSGMRNWGGGSFCSQNTKGLYLPYDGCQIFNTTTQQYQNATGCFKNVPVLCTIGEVKLPYGSPEFVGLGFSVFATIIIIEIFGSPFLRNCSVVIGLLFGYFLAGVTTHNGDKYVTSSKIDLADPITFLWTETFPLKIYGPIVLPMLIVLTITSIETVGDVTATEEASFLSTTGASHDKRIRGSLLNDGVGSIFSSLATSLPLTTFAQNNGIISLTAVASRQAGWAAAIWLFLFGIIGKFGGVITTIPDCVIGGMTTFLFANVISSGIKIMVAEHLSRRNRFIMACSLALGIGVTLVPEWATNALWPCTDCSDGLKGLRDAIIKTLSTGFCIGAIMAMLLNLILPAEEPMIVPQPTSKDISMTSEPSVRYAAPEMTDMEYPVKPTKDPE